MTIFYSQTSSDDENLSKDVYATHLNDVKKRISFIGKKIDEIYNSIESSVKYLKNEIISDSTNQISLKNGLKLLKKKSFKE